MKLIRDKLALTPSPDNRTVILVEPSVRRNLLFDKLLEEAHEIQKAKDSSVELVGELADLSEVVQAIMTEEKITHEMLETARTAKANSHGTFTGRYALL
jgi:predicted house-cleaning noncanonical NTP pyrophosphatase (MazG superfamily)